MKAYLLAALILAGSMVVGGWLYPRSAQCASCFAIPCWSGTYCGEGCSCMLTKPGRSGQCVSFGESR